jgi:protein-disulfide isomerase
MESAMPFRFAQMSRRAAMTGAALASMATLAGCGGGGGAGSVEGDMALGAAEGAKVTVVEYASVTCPHCALWQENTWPAFKAKYVDTNKVRYVFREVPTPPTEVAAAGFLLARCAGADRYFDVVHGLMATQQDMVSAGPRAWLLRTANAVGMNEQQFNACVTDEEGVAALERRVQAAAASGATSTPYFTVNGQTVSYTGGEGARMSDLEPVIEAELRK